MRRIRYQVACSLDGYIAGPDGEFDWIPEDPAIDFEALFAQFDTLLMGRRTYEAMRGSESWFRGKEVVVASRTLRPEEHPGVTVGAEALGGAVHALRWRPGGDSWPLGGGQLCRGV